MTKTRRALLEKTNIIKSEMAEKTKSVRQKDIMKKSTEKNSNPVQVRSIRSKKENATKKSPQKINKVDKKSDTSRTPLKENKKKKSSLKSPKMTKSLSQTSLNNCESVGTRSKSNLNKSEANLESPKVVKNTSLSKSAVNSGVTKNEPKKLSTRSKSDLNKSEPNDNSKTLKSNFKSDKNLKSLNTRSKNDLNKSGGNKNIPSSTEVPLTPKNNLKTLGTKSKFDLNKTGSNENDKNLFETQNLTPKSAQKILNVSLTRSSETEEKIRQRFPSKPARNAKKFQITSQKVNSGCEKILNISLTYDPIVEKKITQKFPRQASQKAKKLLQTLQNSPVTPKKSPEKKGTPDIYEFTFDPSEEKEISKKRKLKQILENSGDLNNSMKEVVQRIRKKEFKTKITKSNRVQKRVGAPKKGKSRKGDPQKSKIEFSPILKNLEPFDPNLETKGSKTRNSEVNSKEGTLGPKNTTLRAQNSLSGIQNSKLGTQNLTLGAENSGVKNLKSKNVCETSENEKNSFSMGQKSESFEVGPISETVQNESVISRNSVMNLENLTLPESIIQSFCGDDNEISPKKFYPSPRNSALGSKSPRITIISNKVVQRGSENKWEQLTGNVRQNVKPNIAQNNPWRLNVVNRNPHTFVVKNTNFTPSYDQDIVINSTLVEKFTKSTPKVIKSPSKEPNFQQTSILDFVNSPRHLNTTLFMSPVKDRTKIGSLRPVDSPTKVASPKRNGSSENVQTEGKSKTSPKKVLGEFNFQSTPYNKNMEKIDLDISRIQSSNRKSPRKSRQTLFGFSFYENSKENVVGAPDLDPSSKKLDVVKNKNKRKENVENLVLENSDELMETKVTGKEKAKKKSLKKVLFNEDKIEKVSESEMDEEFEEKSENLVAQSELEMLFQDPEDEVEKQLQVKKSRFSYERRLKRKRYPSWNESEAENESEDEEGGDRKNTPRKHNKTKAYKRTKQEDEEIDKLAAHYNSMFEEIEEHEFLVE